MSAELAVAATALGRDALDLALGGGEDDALVVTAPMAAQLEGFTPIGVVEAGPPSLSLRCPDGSRVPIAAIGFDHFSKR